MIDYPADYYEDDHESFYCDWPSVFIWAAVYREEIRQNKWKMINEEWGQKGNKTVSKVNVQWCYLRETDGAALLTSEEENFFCKVSTEEINTSFVTTVNGFTAFINIVVLVTVSPQQNQVDENSEAGWSKHSAFTLYEKCDYNT